MKWITILLMKYALKQAIEKQSKEIKYSILYGAYENLIKNYKNTIMFLEAENH